METTLAKQKGGMASFDIKYLTKKHGAAKATEILLIASALHQESQMRIKGGIVNS